MQATVIGVKRIHGIGKESKKPYDMSRFIILNPINESKNDNFNLHGFGYEAIEAEATSEAIAAMQGIKFPAQIVLATEQRVVSGKLATVITGLQK